MQASKIPQYKQVWKAGFPPRIVFSPLTQLSGNDDVSNVIIDRDTLVLEAATAAEMAAAIAGADDNNGDGTDEAEASTPAAPEVPADLTEQLRTSDAVAAKAQQDVATATSAGAADVGQRSHDAPASCAAVPAAQVRTAGAAAGTAVPAAPAAEQPASAPKPKRRKKMEFPGAGFSLAGSTGNAEPPKDTVEAMQRAKDGIAGALLAASRGGAKVGDVLGQDWTPGNKNLFKVLRGDLRDARAARDQEATALAKVSAVRAGQVWPSQPPDVSACLHHMRCRRAQAKWIPELLGSSRTHSISGQLTNLLRAYNASSQHVWQVVNLEQLLQVQFRDLQDGTGRMEVTWPSGRKICRECVPDIPAFLLCAVLVSLYHDADEVVAQNMSPVSMAQVCLTSKSACIPCQL